jgi:hypothetical protein
MCDRHVVEGSDVPRREEGREQGAGGRVETRTSPTPKPNPGPPPATHNRSRLAS